MLEQKNVDITNDDRFFLAITSQNADQLKELLNSPLMKSKIINGEKERLCAVAKAGDVRNLITLLSNGNHLKLEEETLAVDIPEVFDQLTVCGLIRTAMNVSEISEKEVDESKRTNLLQKFHDELYRIMSTRSDEMVEFMIDNASIDHVKRSAVMDLSGFYSEEVRATIQEVLLTNTANQVVIEGDCEVLTANKRARL